MRVNARWVMIVAAMAAIALVSPANATVYYLTTGTGTGGNAWSTPGAWTDENGTPATEFAATDDFVAKGNKTLKVGGPLGCKSFTAGTLAAL